MTTSSEQYRQVLLLIAIALIAINLRPAIAGVGPLIHEIRVDTGLSNTWLGMLTTLPVLALGIFSVLTPVFTRKLGAAGTMALALMLLTTGILIRVIPGYAPLFLGTGILGTGIALGNVLLPGIAKQQFPQKFGLATGIYASMLGAGAALASGISVPLSEGLGLGWRWSLGLWSTVSLLALLIWLPRLKDSKSVIAARSLRSSLKHLGTSRLAWQIAFFMGLQSFTFYILLAWLPEILIERGMSPVKAGWMLSLSQAASILGTFTASSWASSLPRQQLPVVIIVTGELLGLAGLISSPPLLTVLCVAVLGFCVGGSFGLALLFIGLRARNIDSANELSGMVQSVGYTMAAAGPALFGIFYDTMQSWTPPLVLLTMIAVLKMAAGWKAGSGDYV